MDRQSTAMTITLVTTDVTQTTDVLLNLTTQGTFDKVLITNEIGDLSTLFFGEFMSANVAFDANFSKDVFGDLGTDAIDIAHGNTNGLVIRDVCACNTGHVCVPLLGSALTLFVLGVGADHADDAFTADDLAVFTDSFDAGANFHGSSSTLS
tara:strand:+ start:103 stop:558 length:456 start_codon:yes stop_codon:yes gene_type:complete